MRHVRAQSRRGEVAASLAYVVEAFAAREGLPPKYRRRAASMVLDSARSLGDDRIASVLAMSSAAPSAWSGMAGSDDGLALRSTIHACLFAAKRDYDRAYGGDCDRWRKKVAVWSAAHQLLWDGEGRLLNKDSHLPPGFHEVKADKFPDFDAIKRLAAEFRRHRSSSFPASLTNHPQLFGARSMAACGGMI